MESEAGHRGTHGCSRIRRGAAYRSFTFAGIWAVLLTLACAAPIRQFYPDTYFPEDHIYENKPLHFIITFTDNWVIFTSPREMDRNTREFSRSLQKSGVELLFVGATAEGGHGVRAIAANLNEFTADYAAYIRRINAPDIQNDQGLTGFEAGQNPMVKWVYDKDGFRFAEFFFTIDTYDIRIAFWSRPESFERFLPVYEGIIASLQVTGGL